MDNKSDLRRKAKELRKKLKISEISFEIIKQIRKLDIYKNSKNIMIFYPLSEEINLLPLLNDNKNFYLPRVKEDNLEVCKYTYNDNLCKSCYNISEPTCSPVSSNILDIVFVPALAADNNGNRLGYGKGFYDRFLSILSTKTKSAVVIPEELVFNEIPVDKFDVPCDFVITQKKASF